MKALGADAPRDCSSELDGEEAVSASISSPFEQALRNRAVIAAHLAAVGAGVPAHPGSLACSRRWLRRSVAAGIFVRPGPGFAGDGHTRPFEFPASAFRCCHDRSMLRVSDG